MDKDKIYGVIVTLALSCFCCLGVWLLSDCTILKKHHLQPQGEQARHNWSEYLAALEQQKREEAEAIGEHAGKSLYENMREIREELRAELGREPNLAEICKRAEKDEYERYLAGDANSVDITTI